MPKQEFVMRGKTASGAEEILNFSGFKGNGYAYRLVEFSIYPSTNIGGDDYELVGTVTAGKSGVIPITPDFNNEGLIGTTHMSTHMYGQQGPSTTLTIINDTFLITQNLILMVQDTASSAPINWQCRFIAEKMSGPEEAVANFKQFTIYDD